MVIPKAGEVVVLPFPFSDLSENKVRSAVVLARANKKKRLDTMSDHEQSLRRCSGGGH